MRESAARRSESLTPGILEAWLQVAPEFSQSGYPPFRQLGPAIARKVPLEQRLVLTYSDWAAASAEQILPMLEEILALELIPQYQRAVVEAFPDIAQAAAMEVTRRNGHPQNGRGEMLGVLWRTSAIPVGGEGEWYESTLPVVDPVWGNTYHQEHYVRTARRQRRDLATRYLRDWNREAMWVFDHEAKMSQFSTLWRGFTCGELNHLLEEEYPNRNLPFVIRTVLDSTDDASAHLDRHFTFIAVVYWQQAPEFAIGWPWMRGVFASPIDGDATAYAAVRVFVPRPRLIWHYRRPWQSRTPIGGVPGEFPDLPGAEPPGPIEGSDGDWVISREAKPSHWDLLNQNWTCQLVPATDASLATILETVPPLAEADREIVLPTLTDRLTSEDIGRISPH